MLRQLLRVLEELGSQAMVLGRIRAARARAGDRIRPDAASFSLNEGLGRRADNLEVTAHLVGQVQEVHVGRGIDRAQHAVDVDATSRRRHVKALGNDDLEGVTVFNRALGRVDGRLEICARRALAHLGRRRTAAAQNSGGDRGRKLRGHRV